MALRLCINILNKNKIVIEELIQLKNKPIRKKAFIHDDEYYYSLIRINIKKYRQAKHLTQQDLADMTELSREYICDIENESRNKHLTIYVLGRIAEALEIDIQDFFKKK